jgi:hypothetical protein
LISLHLGMRKLYLILTFIFMLLACEEHQPAPVVIPVWLKMQIQEMIDGGDCEGCTVQRWTYNNEYFYHIYCNYWSCSNCEIYRYNGLKVVWGEDFDPADFEKNKQRPIKLWECGDEL